ncbi:MAG: hypothetical protein M1833_001101 [Piccolia ochrophora]|nr:MAG: hypothetical protein M1833_001101 [Piccolia ochrophora]
MATQQWRTPLRTTVTRLLIISDTHTALPAPEEDGSRAYREPLPSADILLHAGDITRVGRLAEYLRSFDVLKAARAELKLVIAGNHDITLDRDYYRRYGGLRHGSEREDLVAVRELWTGRSARDAGIVYLEEGVNTFTLKSGATFTIYTSPYQPEYCQWAFKYERHEDRYNPALGTGNTSPANPVPSYPHIDLMMTHGPPYQRLDRTSQGEDVGCPHLLRAVGRARPRLHCFGHIHEGWGAERVRWGVRSNDAHQVRDQSSAVGLVEAVHQYEPSKAQVLADGAAYIDVSEHSSSPLDVGQETLLVNASIMDVRYRPLQAPWVVDIDLPLAQDGGGGER